VTVNPTYLRVRNWGRFQNKDIFKKSDGSPPWVKFYVKLLDDYEFSRLPYGTQLTYLKLLLVAARKRNAIPNDLEWLVKQTAMDAGTLLEAITVLLQEGWLSQTKSKRESRTIRESVERKIAPRQDKTRQEEIRQEKGLYAESPVENIVDQSLRRIA
jgi:hypothetical protein